MLLILCSSLMLATLIETFLTDIIKSRRVRNTVEMLTVVSCKELIEYFIHPLREIVVLHATRMSEIHTHARTGLVNMHQMER